MTNKAKSKLTIALGIIGMAATAFLAGKKFYNDYNISRQAAQRKLQVEQEHFLPGENEEPGNLQLVEESIEAEVRESDGIQVDTISHNIPDKMDGQQKPHPEKFVISMVSGLSLFLVPLIIAESKTKEYGMIDYSSRDYKGNSSAKGYTFENLVMDELRAKGYTVERVAKKKNGADFLVNGIPYQMKCCQNVYCYMLKLLDGGKFRYEGQILMVPKGDAYKVSQALKKAGIHATVVESEIYTHDYAVKVATPWTHESLSYDLGIIMKPIAKGLSFIVLPIFFYEVSMWKKHKSEGRPINKKEKVNRLLGWTGILCLAGCSTVTLFLGNGQYQRSR